MNYRSPTESEKKYVKCLTPGLGFRLMESCTSAMFITIVLALILYFILLIFFRNIPNRDRLTLILVASAIGFVAMIIRVFFFLKARDRQTNLLRSGDFQILTTTFDFIVDTNRISVQTVAGSRILFYTDVLSGCTIDSFKKGTKLIACKLNDNKVYIAPCEESISEEKQQ